MFSVFWGSAAVLALSRGRHGMTLWHDGSHTPQLSVPTNTQIPHPHSEANVPMQNFPEISLVGSIFGFSTGLEWEPIYFPGDEDSVSQEFMPMRTVLPRCHRTSCAQSHKLGDTGCKSKSWRLSSFHW